MSIYVVDASVAVKWFIHSPFEAHHLEAEWILKAISEGSIKICQPAHWVAETLASVTRLNPNVSERANILLNGLDLDIESDIDDYSIATKLAVEYQHHLFDTLYHATALNREGQLITADRRYYRKAKASGGITMLEDFDWPI